MSKYQGRNIAWQAHKRQQMAAGAAATLAGNSLAGKARALEMLSSTDPTLRETAVKNLAALHDRTMIDAISRRTDDQVPRVRLAACKALGQLRAHEAKARLYDCLLDRDPLVLCAAAEALARMGDKSGLNKIGKLLDKRGPDQYRALRVFNHITGKSFGIDTIGLKAARKYFKAKRRFRLF